MRFLLLRLTVGVAFALAFAGPALAVPTYVASTWSPDAIYILDQDFSVLSSFAAGAIDPNGVVSDGTLIYSGHPSPRKSSPMTSLVSSSSDGRCHSPDCKAWPWLGTNSPSTTHSPTPLTSTTRPPALPYGRSPSRVLNNGRACLGRISSVGS